MSFTLPKLSLTEQHLCSALINYHDTFDPFLVAEECPINRNSPSLLIVNILLSRFSFCVTTIKLDILLWFELVQVCMLNVDGERLNKLSETCFCMKELALIYFA